ncbi:MAG: PTS fructose transporter subunit IIBC [Solirubrobacteraceae bacterium]|nr:PTS fructose transporter subunit IIBC [Solirubrobacteraceae bacterium]
MNIVAVTSCPTGIAHTYMAAEALEQAAKAAGHTIHVETQGSAGLDAVSPEVIAAADAVIFAADVEVRERQRFDGKPLVTGTVKDGINHADDLVARAVAAAEKAPAGSTSAAAAPDLVTKTEEGASFGTQLRGWLMTGVSYMIPFVAAGGLLIALAFIIGGGDVVNQVNGGTYNGKEYEAITDVSTILSEVGIAGVLFKLGALAFGLLVPVLAGFIAFAMADRPGLAPGFVAGLVASEIGAGFLGGLVGGLLAGGLALWLSRIQVPAAVRGMMPVLVVPLLATAIVGFLMLQIVGPPIADLQTALTDWLNGLDGASSIVLGLILGGMMAVDLGGPVNKVAYTFGVAGVASGSFGPMAAVMVAGMTPPIAMALATVLRPKLFNDAERKAGESAWLLGGSFITEGAIPFAAADPLRVLPSAILGSAAAGALVMALDVTSRAPHGGIWVVGLIGNPLGYILAILLGTGITAAAVIALKSHGARKAGSPDGAAAAATSTARPAAQF